MEPGAVPGIPEKPAGLSPKVSAAWDHFAHHANTMGILSTSDGAALLRLAKQKAEVDDLDEDIQANGRTYNTVTRNGDTMIRVRPQVRLRERAELMLRNYLIEFGLTPTARSRVTRVVPKAKDDAESYFT
jgi:P27 family predicted phage terminase small subunit